jgi:preprotein translocase subunit YajC
LSILVIAAMFALLWVLLIRPQRRRQQAQQQLLTSVEPGDEVLTVGGMYGIVHEIDEDNDLIVEIAEGIRVRIARRSVAGVVKPEDEDDIVDGEAEEENDADPVDAVSDATAGGTVESPPESSEVPEEGRRRSLLRGRRPPQ